MQQAGSITQDVLGRLVELRHELHRRPELSGAEAGTASFIAGFLEPLKPDRLLRNIGGHGLAAVFHGDDPQAGPCIGFRCELDALPIQESNTMDYRSLVTGVSHKCGHDGHMASVAGLALLAAATRPRRGRLVLLFQPAEETGEGGPAFAADPLFAELGLDHVFAYHNLPALPLGTVAVRSGTFTCASKGMRVRLVGKTAHASSPQDGVSPALPMCRIIEELSRPPESRGLPNFNRVTVVGAKLGEEAYGATPGDAEVWATLRTEADDTMDALENHVASFVHETALAGNVTVELTYCDVFTTTQNNEAAVDNILTAARELKLRHQILDEPLRFSEDFGALTARVPGAMFGLGSGPGPQLHNDDYDFPDTLLEQALGMLRHIAAQLLDW
ncbi:hipO [Symbiodinium natans]|uniref:HipO protein n=1 Tax=Symbiodinium natans TaxID=878477 RepID=A0A812SZH7_9DINO|nr:hipO [Symbiodinium natans]